MMLVSVLVSVDPSMEKIQLAGSHQQSHADREKIPTNLWR